MKDSASNSRAGKAMKSGYGKAKSKAGSGVDKVFGTGRVGRAIKGAGALGEKAVRKYGVGAVKALATGGPVGLGVYAGKSLVGRGAKIASRKFQNTKRGQQMMNSPAGKRASSMYNSKAGSMARKAAGKGLSSLFGGAHRTRRRRRKRRKKTRGRKRRKNKKTRKYLHRKRRTRRKN